MLHEDTINRIDVCEPTVARSCTVDLGHFDAIEGQRLAVEIVIVSSLRKLLSI